MRGNRNVFSLSFPCFVFVFSVLFFFFVHSLYPFFNVCRRLRNMLIVWPLPTYMRYRERNFMDGEYCVSYEQFHRASGANT